MHRKVNDVRSNKIEAGIKTSMQVLLEPEEMPNFALRKFTIEEGGKMPMHTNIVEHEQYVLKGNACVTLDDESFEVSEGSVVYIPANVPHCYKNIGKNSFEFLCIVPNKEDKIELA
ncbi:MAG TPA: cupin domain-containing protein [Victivallales bacterium]|nr:cupin domain-containing protein [Victivallales bacterium]